MSMRAIVVRSPGGLQALERCALLLPEPGPSPARARPA